MSYFKVFIEQGILVNYKGEATPLWKFAPEDEQTFGRYDPETEFDDEEEAIEHANNIKATNMRDKFYHIDVMEFEINAKGKEVEMRTILIKDAVDVHFVASYNSLKEWLLVNDKNHPDYTANETLYNSLEEILIQ